ncbi:hypothetical protein ANN_09521 [Periplaneta americana]|uniref:Uncharacterized protein n=1 Tax=Periplaneta americana TaxID=6978 RepID=A0ABQ8TPI5_PERAM|nr:hypothetical protein ANN_09521 [Periplaneta americana]
MEPADKQRKVFTHEEYISLVLRSGQFMSHDYSHQSTKEDPRMMAFFDSLVQREIEGWSSEESIRNLYVQVFKSDTVRDLINNFIGTSVSKEQKDECDSSSSDVGNSNISNNNNNEYVNGSGAAVSPRCEISLSNPATPNMKQCNRSLLHIETPDSGIVIAPCSSAGSLESSSTFNSRPGSSSGIHHVESNSSHLVGSGATDNDGSDGPDWLILKQFKNRLNRALCSIITQKFLVQQHITTSKHQANKQLNSKQRQLFLTQPTTSNVRSEFNIDLCRSLISADIPLYKLKNKVFREFLEKYTQHTIPDESTLRKTYAPSIYDETIQKIRDEIKDSSIWVSIDETPDKEGRLVEKCNNKTIVKLFNEAMGILWPKGIMYDNVLFFISDAALIWSKLDKHYLLYILN